MSKFRSLAQPSLRIRSICRVAVALLLMAGVAIVGDGARRSHKAQILFASGENASAGLLPTQPLRETVQLVVRTGISTAADDDGNRAVDRLQQLFLVATGQIKSLIAEQIALGEDPSIAAADGERLQYRMAAVTTEAETMIRRRTDAAREVAMSRAASLIHTAAVFEHSVDEWRDRTERNARRRTAEGVAEANTVSHWIGLLIIGLAVCGLRSLAESTPRSEVRPLPTVDTAAHSVRLEHDLIAIGAAQESPIPLIVLDTRGAIVWANRATLSSLGYSHEEFVGRALREFGESVDAADEIAAQLRAGKAIHAAPMPLRSNDGTVRSFLLDGVVTPSPRGALLARCVLRNVTGQMQLQDALGASERRLQALVVQSPVGVFLTDANGSCTFLNEKACELLGMSFVRASGFGWKDAIHPDDRIAVAEDWRRAVVAEALFQREFRYLRPNGSIVWVMGRAAPLRDTSGGVLEYVGTITDVTRLKETEEAYRESDRRFRTMADTAPVLICKQDAEGATTFLNRRWLEFRGRTEVEEYGEGWLEGVHDEDRERVAREFDTGRLEPREFSLQFRLKRHDGVYRWVLQTAVPRRLADGTFVGYIGSCIDVTDQKEVEERIRLSEERYAIALRGSSDTLFDWDLTTGQIYQSAQMAETLGYDPQETASNLDWFLDALYPPDREGVWQAVQDHLERDVPFDVEYRMRTKAGALRWFRSRGRAVRNEAAAAVRLAGSTIDVTVEREHREAVLRHASETEKARRQIERQAETLSRQAEELNEANEKVRAASRSKDAFLANMSHEIRTPLNVVLGMTDLVLETEMTDDQRELLRNVRTSGEHLLTLIDDVLDFSKIEAGKLRLDSVDFSIVECVRQSVQMFASSAGQKGLELQTVIADDVPETVRGDSHRIRQILLNLIGNAIKFTAQGSVSTTVKLCPANGESPTHRLHFTIADTGTGISEAQLLTIFQPFEQGDGSRTRQFGGTGLGLSIVRRLVEMMNGRTWVESQPQQGSRFHFEIELAAANATTLTPSPVAVAEDAVQAGPLPVGLPTLRVLVAEDNAMNQNLIVRILKTAGHDVTVVSDGAAAVSAVARSSFDLLLMDMQMPVVGGIEATGLIRDAERRSQRRRTPIVALTANAMRGDREACLNAGMDGYVPKPIRREVLFDEMERVWREQNTILASGLSVDNLMDRIEYDDELLADMVQLLDEMAPALVDGLTEAGRNGRVSEVRSYAHKLRGSIGVFGPSSALSCFERVESAARAEEPTCDVDAIELAHVHFELLREDLHSIVNRTALHDPAAT